MELPENLEKKVAAPEKKIIAVRDRKKDDFFTGRRKTSVAQVKIIKGSGKVLINKKPIEEFFGREAFRFIALRPVSLLEKPETYDVIARVSGGGNSGQAGAISLGLARALQTNEPQLHQTLREKGLLTRDSRMVERKKYGLHKARRATQFSKR